MPQMSRSPDSLRWALILAAYALWCWLLIGPLGKLPPERIPFGPVYKERGE